MAEVVETKERLAEIARTEASLLADDFNAAKTCKVTTENDREFFYHIRQAENRLEKIKNYINMIGALNGKP